MVGKRYCIDCLKKGEETVIGEGNHRGGAYYWCPECKGAVRTLIRGSKLKKLLIEVDPSASIKEMAVKIEALLSDISVMPNRHQNALELTTPWSINEVEGMVKNIPGIKNTMFYFPQR